MTADQFTAGLQAWQRDLDRRIKRALADWDLPELARIVLGASPREIALGVRHVREVLMRRPV